MTTDELLSAWDSRETRKYVFARRIELWKWRCYALAAGAVDGRKWKGAEIARERKVSRARICVVLKEVARKLAAAEETGLKKETRRFLYYVDLRNVLSVRDAFGLNSGQKKEFGGHCYPDVLNSVFVAEGREWMCDEVAVLRDGWSWRGGWSDRLFALRCSEWRGGDMQRDRLDANVFLGIYSHPLVVNCGGKFWSLDRLEVVSRYARITLRPL